jgi:hypothetical protein
MGEIELSDSLEQKSCFGEIAIKQFSRAYGAMYASHHEGDLEWTW